MSIGWFPGHMVTARKKAAETLEISDVVIEVVDARVPGASSNPMIEAMRLHRQRPCLKILNKADLADPAVTAAWVAALSGQKQITAVALSCKKPADVARIPRMAAALVPHRDSTLKPVRAMIMGVPNVGKSTLINALLRRKVAKTGNEPAVTKQQSRHQLDERMDLIDTPGMMWPKIEYAEDGLMLAASHVIGDNAFIDDEVNVFLAERLLKHYPALLAERYGRTPPGMDGVGLIEAIARKRGFRLKGGAFDHAKAGLALLQDYRSGALGRISLETPESRAHMLASAKPSQGESFVEGEDPVEPVTS